MKEQELLRAIRNADRKYYTEAEQRIHNREEHTMKSTIIRHIISGTAAAAVLAVTVMSGLKIYNTYAERSSQPITTATPSRAASAPVISESAQNLLGGHGPLHFSAAGRLMQDSDNWYFSTAYKACKEAGSPAEIHNTTVQAGDEAKQEQYLTDRAGGGLYVHNTQTGAIYALADDGSRTTLRAEGAPDVQHRDIQRIMRLTDTKYYIDGFCSSAAEEYWEIFDTATGAATSGEQIFQSYDRIFSDGGTGIYATVENGDHYAVAHITEEKTEIVLDKPARPYGWYVSGSCIYYLTTDGNSDFSKFDMETGEDTVMEQNSGITMIVPAGDRVYIQLDADPATGSAPVISCKPDLSDRKEFTVAYPEDITAKNGVCYLMDVCGDSLYFDVLVEEETTPVTDSNFYECKPNCLLYNMSTNTVQTYFSK